MEEVVRLRVWERAQDDGVEDRQDRCVRGEAECEAGDDGDAEGGGATEASHDMSN